MPYLIRERVLDHGYTELIETWGSDRRIIESARMSTGAGFKGWGPLKECKRCGFVLGENDDGSGSLVVSVPSDGCSNDRHDWKDPKKGDERLLRYLYENRHSTPFEMAGLTIQVKAPIFIFRQWHRHRTQCLAPDTLVHFESPNKGGRKSRRIYKLTMEQLWERWQATERRERPERQTNPYRKRDRVKGMHLRCFDEERGEFVTTHIVDVIKGDTTKLMVRVTTASGRQIVASRDHMFLTNGGWLKLGRAIELGAHLTLEGTRRNKAERLEEEVPEVDERDERWRGVFGWEKLYEVSSWGRVRRVNCTPKKPTVGAQGYDVVSLSNAGTSYAFTVHNLVLKAFVGVAPQGCEARHLNGNKADNRLENLRWGTAKENAQDRIDHDRQQRLVATFEEIVSVEEVGELPTYDLAVEGPWHNFTADGFVVHNSYNEMSARYTPLPNENYMPTVDRCLVVAGKNKQAGKAARADELTHEMALKWLEALADVYERAQNVYSFGLQIGIPKELARLPVPVGRYSVMRASANLRNWLAFMTLRCDAHAQQEIQAFGWSLARFIKQSFPRTYELWGEGMEP